MKKLILIVIAMVFLTACGQSSENTQITEITREAVYMNITAQQAKEITELTRQADNQKDTIKNMGFFTHSCG